MLRNKQYIDKQYRVQPGQGARRQSFTGMRFR